MIFEFQSTQTGILKQKYKEDKGNTYRVKCGMCGNKMISNNISN